MTASGAVRIDGLGVSYTLPGPPASSTRLDPDAPEAVKLSAEVTNCVWEEPGECTNGHELRANRCWDSKERPGWTFYYCPVNTCSHFIGKKKKKE